MLASLLKARYRGRLYAVVPILACLPSIAGAALVTFQVTGQLLTVDLTRPNDPLAAIFSPQTAVGDQIEVTYTFDSTSPDLAAVDPTAGLYHGAITSAHVRIGNDGFSMFPQMVCGNCGSTIAIQNDFTGGGGFWDRFDVTPRYSFGGSNYQVFISLFSASQSPTNGTTSDQLPLLPPDPANFLDNFGRVSSGVVGPPSLTFRPLEMAVVPLPAGLTLLSSALGVMGWLRRRNAA